MTTVALERKREEVLNLARMYVAAASILDQAVKNYKEGGLDFVDYHAIEDKIRTQSKNVHAAFLVPDPSLLREALSRVGPTVINIEASETLVLNVDDEVEEEREYDDGL